ncbi:MAG: hypothetical protein FDX18_07200 [Chlorobium sp.]|nr:MAG: hypothetical protein FDX18_07200 [Chlorobium sp.]
MSAGDKLRDEILGFQKAQFELIRWKLIATGATIITAFSGTNAQQLSWLAFTILPVVVVYCDLISRDYDIRIALIAFFLQRQGGEYGAYEEFLREPGVSRSRPWLLGNTAMRMSSAIVCILVILLGLQPKLIFGNNIRLETNYIPVVAGFAGILLLFLIEQHSREAYERISNMTANSSSQLLDKTSQHT